MAARRDRRGDSALSGRGNAAGGRVAATEPARVLIAQTSFLGDVVLTTALAQAIEAARPASEIWWMVRPDAAPLLVPTYGSERVLVFDKRGVDRGLAGVWRTARRLRSCGFDLAFGVQRSLRTAVALAAAGIRERIGYAGSAGAWLYSRRVPKRGAHARDRLVALASGLDGAPSPAAFLPRLDVAPAAANRVEARMRDAHVEPEAGLLVLAPGSAWATKQWPARRFGEAAARLRERGRERVVVLGRAEDRRWAREIAEVVVAAGAPVDAVLDVTGEGGIDDAVAWISRARLVLANDSAPAHIAAALGRPVVALFGPTVPGQGFAPLGETVRIVERSLDCRPCSRHGGAVCPIGTHACLAELPAAEVVDAAERLLEAAPAEVSS